MADLPVISFIQERIAESEANGGIPLETRTGTAFYDLFVIPQELMLQPLVSAMETNLTAQSVSRILATATPDTFDQGLVNDLASNVYISRDQGQLAAGTVRVFYEQPVDREFPAFTAEFDSGTLAFFNPTDFVITQAQMSLQQLGGLFYCDYPAQAQTQGDSFNLPVTAGVTFVNDTAAVSAQFLTPVVGGLPTETNTQLLNRIPNSIGVRDLETVKGINAIISENFPAITEIVSIGYGDPEMQRDILFNAHVGGKTDIYLKTPALQVGSTNVIGLGFDTTRQLSNDVHLQLTALTYTDPNSNLGTPNIVPQTLSVESDTIPTAAQFITTHVPAVTGINLTGAEWIKLQLDNAFPINIKISGATVSATQRFEIVNAINLAVGTNIATNYGVDQILVQSTTTGTNSMLELFQPDSPRSDGTVTLIPSATGAGYSPPTPAIYMGTGPVVYVENVDYQVDYTNGKIIQLFGSAILSGNIVAESPGSGLGNVTTGSNVFSSPTSGAFSLVHIGDELNITTSTGVALGTYIVSAVVNSQTLQILGMRPTSNDASVQYNIVSQQVVVVDYKYNPLSVDVGPMVLLSDGISRGIRPGRSAYTITDVAFINILSIQEIDPVTQSPLGVTLMAPSGFGSGGFGLGAFGVSSGGDYDFIVNDTTTRFSAFEDSVITFSPTWFGSSFQITYYMAPEILAAHNLCRNDGERVTGADVLPKNFVPCFVDTTIGIRRNPSNSSTPTDAALTQLVVNQIPATLAGVGLATSAIEETLMSQGLTSVQSPITLTGTVYNTDGSTTILNSEDVLAVPAVTLPSATPNYVTPKITHFYSGNVVLNEVS